jgi:hypothetical protein
MARMQTIFHHTGRAASVPRSSVPYWMRQGWTTEPHTRPAAADFVNVVDPEEVPVPEGVEADDEPDGIYDVDGTMLPPLNDANAYDAAKVLEATSDHDESADDEPGLTAETGTAESKVEGRKPGTQNELSVLTEES